MTPGLFHFQVQNYVIVLSQCLFNLNRPLPPYPCHHPAPSNLMQWNRFPLRYYALIHAIQPAVTNAATSWQLLKR